jgi:hypothetical protein
MRVNLRVPLNLRSKASSSSCEVAVKVAASRQKYKILRRFFLKFSHMQFHVDLISSATVAAGSSGTQAG